MGPQRELYDSMILRGRPKLDGISPRPSHFDLGDEPRKKSFPSRAMSQIGSKCSIANFLEDVLPSPKPLGLRQTRLEI